ncbi:MAG: hypothetical protein LBQ21_04005 [Clostridiales Family XIII bacterium]|jgi:hypothetical protein|nr:hypothetical protein [Clostridiales Family XIII bacterium]
MWDKLTHVNINKNEEGYGFVDLKGKFTTVGDASWGGMADAYEDWICLQGGQYTVFYNVKTGETIGESTM